MKSLFLIIPLTFLVSCGVSVESDGNGGPGDRGPQNRDGCFSASCLPEIKQPLPSECNGEFLQESVICRTQESNGNYTIITKDSLGNPVFQYEGMEFVFTTLSDVNLTGKDFETSCSELSIEKFYSTKYTKFQLIHFEQLDLLIDQRYEDIFITVEGRLILQDKDSDGWNKVVDAKTGKKIGNTHPERNKYKSLCIAYPDVEFTNKKVYIEYNWAGSGADSIFWTDWYSWRTKNKERLSKKVAEREMAAAKKRCAGDAIRLSSEPVIFSHEKDEDNTGSYFIYGQSNSTFKCK